MDDAGRFDAYRTSPSPESLLALLQVSQRTVYNLCHQILRHRQDAEDAAQKVLLEAVDALPGITSADHFRKWIYRTCYYVALGLRKAQRRRKDHERNKAAALAADFQLSSEDAAEAVHESVFALDENERALVVDHYFEKRSLQSLAAENGCSKVAIWKRIEKARESIRRSLLEKGAVSVAAGLEKFLQSSVPRSTDATSVAGGGSVNSAGVVGGSFVSAKSISVAVLLALLALLPLGYFARREGPRDVVPPVVPVSRPKVHDPRSNVTRREVAVGATPTALIEPEPASSPDPLPPAEEPRGPVGSTIRWFVQAQNPDGSWGNGSATIDGHPIGKVGMTGLALLAILSAGYTPLSLDTCSGVKLCDVVQKALQFLTQDQRQDGSFGSARDVIEQAVASLALCEAYGMTASKPLMEPARNGFRALQEAQLKDGSWGDLYQTLWSSYVLVSGKLSELPFDGDRLKRTQDYFRSQLDAGPNLPAMVGSLMVDKDRSHPAMAETARWVAVTPPQWSQQDFGYWYMGSMALYQYDGSEGPLWKSWNDRFKQTLLPTQQKEGYWPGGDPNQTLVRTALGSLALQIYYRFSNVVGTPK